MQYPIKGGQALEAIDGCEPKLQEGRRCAAYDIDYDGKYMDILQPEGYAVALYNVLRLRPGGSLTLAPVCSSWVWLHFGDNSKLYRFSYLQVSYTSIRAARTIVIERSFFGPYIV